MNPFESRKPDQADQSLSPNSELSALPLEPDIAEHGAGQTVSEAAQVIGKQLGHNDPERIEEFLRDADR